MARLKITRVRSTIGSKPIHRKCVKALGLNRIHKTVDRQDTPEIRGLIQKINHLLRVEQCN